MRDNANYIDTRNANKNYDRITGQRKPIKEFIKPSVSEQLTEKNVVAVYAEYEGKTHRRTQVRLYYGINAGKQNFQGK